MSRMNPTNKDFIVDGTNLSTKIWVFSLWEDFYFNDNIPHKTENINIFDINREKLFSNTTNKSFFFFLSLTFLTLLLHSRV